MDVATRDSERAVLWLLHQSDGHATLKQVAPRRRALPGRPARRGAARPGGSSLANHAPQVDRKDDWRYANPRDLRETLASGAQLDVDPVALGRWTPA